MFLGVPYLSDLSMSFCSPSVIVHTILLMSQRGEHQESKKELETSPSETMKAEEKSYKEEDKASKSEDWRPPSVFGAADLKNSNQVLSIFCMHIFCLSCLLFHSLFLGFVFSFTPLPRNMQMILILHCQETILGFDKDLHEDLRAFSPSNSLYWPLQLRISK